VRQPYGENREALKQTGPTSKSPDLPASGLANSSDDAVLLAKLRHGWKALLSRLKTQEKQPDRSQAAHPVLMYYSRLESGWYCIFFDSRNLNVRLPRRLKFRDSEKVKELIQRGNADLKSVEAQRALADSIKLGRGKIWLHLSEVQRATLD